MGTLEIRLFGVLALERDGHPLDRLPSRKVKDLLAYLLLNHRSPQSREQLAACSGLIMRAAKPGTASTRRSGGCARPSTSRRTILIPISGKKRLAAVRAETSFFFSNTGEMEFIRWIAPDGESVARLQGDQQIGGVNEAPADQVKGKEPPTEG